MHALNCIICLTRESVARTKLVLESVPLDSSLKILKQDDAASSLIGGVLYEMLNSVLEDRGYDYSKRELGQPIKKFPVPKLLPTLFEYFKECCKVAKNAALNSLLNAVVKVTDSRVVNEEVLNKELINFMITLVVNGNVSYEHAQQISIVVSKMWTRTRVDDKKSLQFVRQISTVINPRILSGEEQHQMLALRALNILLQVRVLTSTT